MTASKVFLYFCLSFVFGIFLNSLIKIPQLAMLGVLILGILLISVLWRYKKLAVIGFSILFIVLGISCHQAAGIRNPQSATRIGENIVLTGIISDETDIREKSQRLMIKAAGLDGKILVNASRYPEYKYGDKLKITGKMEMPSEDIGGFNYRNYLAKDGIYSTMSFPKTELLGSGFGNPIMRLLLSFKNRFKEAAQKFIPPPQEGFLEALVFGDEENISKPWKDKLNLTGTRHIAAVSGMNITIISGLLLSFLLLLGFWRGQAFYFSVVLLVLYILMIGAPASAVRAGVMAGVFLSAQRLGRLSSASRAIVFASTFMLALNPLLLRLDVGFQLSFLAIMGIVYLQQFFQVLLRKIPNPKLFPLRTTLSATLSAQVFTLPILIYNFGYFSLLSPVTNILIVPFLAPITILIFIFGFAGMIFWGLGWILSLPVFFVLSYITRIIDIFSRIPFNSLKLENVHWIWLMIFYLALGLAVWRLQESQKLKFLKY
ncbi:MAG: ComEC/Rec2 family competence protein [bacterium]|nr:ComEC/Rec2 family competence protein [bacterium]